MWKIFGKAELDWNDCYINFKNNEGKIFRRYHHAYTLNEIKNIFIRAGFAIVSCEIKDGRNIVLIGNKA